MNTREYRTRKRLEEERHKYIQQMQDLNADYKPPMDYKWVQIEVLVCRTVGQNLT